MDRTEFLRRGAMFGLSVGAMGSLLAFAGEAGAATATKARFASAKKGGTIRVGIAAFGASLEPYLLNEGGSLAFAGHPRRVPDVHEPAGAARPGARDQLEAERRRDRSGRSRSGRASSSTTARR